MHFIAVIFGNVLTLLEVNEKLLLELQYCSNDGEKTSKDNETTSTLGSVAEAFRNYTPYLKLYSLYASGYQQADNLLQVRFHKYAFMLCIANK